MQYFDFLITRGEAPDPKKEYIYLLDQVWAPRGLESTSIQRLTIVNNLSQTDGGRYLFTIKDTGENHSCTYAWAFAENTPDNLERIKTYDNVYAEYLALKKRLKITHKQIDTLECKK